MTPRQQLILFVLALAAMSTCTVGFALAMNLVRDMSIQASAADLPPVVAPPVETALEWQPPPTPVPSPTITPLPTATNTRVPTWTPAPTYTPTPTRMPTETPTPAPTNTPVPPPRPPSTPVPVAPTPTPTPEFPYDVIVETFDTGTPQVTRITGMVWRIVDESLAQYEAVPGYQMRMVDPNGGVHLSDVSGIGGTSSTCDGCGDNRRMNMKIEYSPYLPGTYRVSLVLDEQPASAEVSFTLGPNPQQYMHVNFVPWD
jgi:hypothetical protein